MRCHLHNVVFYKSNYFCSANIFKSLRLGHTFELIKNLTKSLQSFFIFILICILGWLFGKTEVHSDRQSNHTKYVVFSGALYNFILFAYFMGSAGDRQQDCTLQNYKKLIY